MEDLEIICDGDSWVFGSEIVDPKIVDTYPKGTYAGEFDFYDINDNYRIPRIFPTFLSQKLNAKVTNLAWPADDNGTILNRTMVYLSKEYLSKGKSVDNLFVIIGWSSPERNVFFYKDEHSKLTRRFRLWPQVKHFDSKHQEDFWNIYVQYLWNPEEYLPRYIMNVLQFQNFCKVHNIKWLCFNSFYQTPNKNITEWSDLNIREELMKINSGGAQYHKSNDSDNTRRTLQFQYTELWDTIDSIRFYKKDKEQNTFYSFIKKFDTGKMFNGWHPSPIAHELWATELCQYIDDNKLFKIK